MNLKLGIVADKLRAIRFLEAATEVVKQFKTHPRLAELLLFLQWHSMQPGGLEAMVADLVKRLAGRFVTAAMREAGQPKDGAYSLEEILPIWRADWVRYTQFRNGRRTVWALDGDIEELGFLEWFPSNCYEEYTARILRNVCNPANIERFLRENNYAWMAAGCEEVAKETLPKLLAEFARDVNRPLLRESWWCPDLIKTMFDYMDDWAVRAQEKVALTEVTKLAFERLEFAQSQKVPVPFVGESRFGKTESCRVWCEAHPGLARHIVVPQSIGEGDFLRAHAEVLGLDYSEHVSHGRLKAAVEYAMHESGLMPVYDEAQYLIPLKYTKTTPPRRLNWVRTHVIDRHLGCAFFATPQSYRETLDRYVKVTGYRMEQWLGRMAPPVILPADLSPADILAAARKMFPDFDPDLLELICSRSMRSEAYLKAIDLVCRRALFLAAKAGRGMDCSLEDVERALAEMIPAGEPARTARSGAETASVLQAPSRLPAEDVHLAKQRDFSPSMNRATNRLQPSLDLVPAGS